MIPLAIPCILGNEEKYLKECISTNYVSSVGPFVDRFEQMLCENSNSKYATALSSGTAALHMALLAVGVQNNDLVIMPSYTFIATANAISHCGAHPWIFDVSLEDWNLNLKQLEEVLEQKTYFDGSILRHNKTHQRVSAVVPVFCMGATHDYESLARIASKYNLSVVVDAAAGIGAKYQGKEIGDLPADATILSFNGNKTITSGGGGAVLSNNESVIKKVKHLSQTGRVGPNYEHDCVAYNYRMTNLQAAVGCAQLEQLDDILKKKKEISLFYSEAFSNNPSLELFPQSQGGDSPNWLSGVLLKDLKVEQVTDRLQELGIQSRLFWKPMHMQKPYKNSLCENVENANSIWDRILVLPSSVSITQKEMQYVSDTLLNIISGIKNEK